MAIPANENPQTWEARLKSGKLDEDEWKVLRAMVASEEAESLEEAARLLDFKDRELNLDDSFYAF
jgi:hypothetical protein